MQLEEVDAAGLSCGVVLVPRGWTTDAHAHYVPMSCSSSDDSGSSCCCDGSFAVTSNTLRCEQYAPAPCSSLYVTELYVPRCAPTRRRQHTQQVTDTNVQHAACTHAASLLSSEAAQHQRRARICEVAMAPSSPPLLPSSSSSPAVTVAHVLLPSHRVFVHVVLDEPAHNGSSCGNSDDTTSADDVVQRVLQYAVQRLSQPRSSQLLLQQQQRADDACASPLSVCSTSMLARVHTALLLRSAQCVVELHIEAPTQRSQEHAQTMARATHDNDAASVAPLAANAVTTLSSSLYDAAWCTHARNARNSSSRSSGGNDTASSSCALLRVLTDELCLSVAHTMCCVQCIDGSAAAATPTPAVQCVAVATLPLSGVPLHHFGAVEAAFKAHVTQQQQRHATVWQLTRLWTSARVVAPSPAPDDDSDNEQRLRSSLYALRRVSCAAHGDDSNEDDAVVYVVRLCAPRMLHHCAVLVCTHMPASLLPSASSPLLPQQQEQEWLLSSSTPLSWLLQRVSLALPCSRRWRDACARDNGDGDDAVLLFRHGRLLLCVPADEVRCRRVVVVPTAARCCTSHGSLTLYATHAAATCPADCCACCHDPTTTATAAAAAAVRAVAAVWTVEVSGRSAAEYVDYVVREHRDAAAHEADVVVLSQTHTRAPATRTRSATRRAAAAATAMTRADVWLRVAQRGQLYVRVCECAVGCVLVVQAQLRHAAATAAMRDALVSWLDCITATVS